MDYIIGYVIAISISVMALYFGYQDFKDTQEILRS